jgi:hypothetical protein
MSNDDPLTYSQRVFSAYESLADEMKTPDVPIHAIHRRVGGSLFELQNHLQAECLAHRATPSTGEPAFAGGCRPAKRALAAGRDRPRDRKTTIVSADQTD